MGGKRVCLGKTFAEVTVRFTVPMLFHHLDFAFVNHEEQSKFKMPYGVGGSEEIKIPMRVTIRNKAV